MRTRSFPSALAEKIERAGAPCPEHPWAPKLAAILTEREASSLIRHPSFALYVVLLLLAHSKSGRILVVKDALAGLFHVTPPEIDAWLSELERSHLVCVLSGGEYLALVIEKWPNERPKQPAPSRKNPSKTMLKNPPSIPPPSSALLRSAQESFFESARRNLQSRAEAKRNDGDGVEGPGGGEEGFRAAFLDRLVEVLGAPNERSLETFCRPYPREILEAALDRVERTPLEKIKKSRGALFVHLVKTFAQSNAE